MLAGPRLQASAVSATCGQVRRTPAPGACGQETVLAGPQTLVAYCGWAWGVKVSSGPSLSGQGWEMICILGDTPTPDLEPCMGSLAPLPAWLASQPHTLCSPHAQ